jgi:hypothetical protein
MREGIALLAAALAVAGCARMPVKAYDGPTRPRSEVAVLQGGASGDQMSAHSVIEYPSIDGVRRADAPYVVSVLPGARRVGLRHTLSFGPAKRVQFCAFDIETAPGCLYTPSPPLPPPAALTGKGDDFQWSVELPVSIECGGGSAFVLRYAARCGSAPSVLEQKDPR